jgi:hypothetical protein
MRNEEPQKYAKKTMNVKAFRPGQAGNGHVAREFDGRSFLRFFAALLF